MKSNATIGSLYNLTVGQKCYIVDEDDITGYECVITDGAVYKYYDPSVDCMLIGIDTLAKDILDGRDYSVFNTSEEADCYYSEILDNYSGVVDENGTTNVYTNKQLQ